MGGCTLRVRTAWLSGLGYRQHLVGFGWAVSLLFFMNGLRKLLSHLVRPPIPFLALNIVWMGVC